MAESDNVVDVGEGVHSLYHNIQVLREAGYSVISGCKPTAGSTGLEVDVSSGDVLFGGTKTSVSAGKTTLNSADPDDPRKDVIYIDTNGAIQNEPGTPASALPDTNTHQETYRPSPPSMINTDAVVVGEVWVGAGVSSLGSDDVFNIREFAQTTVEQLDALEADITGDATIDGNIIQGDVTIKYDANAGSNGAFIVEDTANNTELVRVDIGNQIPDELESGGAHPITIGNLQDFDPTEVIIDTAANQPAAGTADRIQIITDTAGGPVIERDNGTSWELVAASPGALKDGGYGELDVADLAGDAGAAGQFAQSDGAAVSWVDADFADLTGSATLAQLSAILDANDDVEAEHLVAGNLPNHGSRHEDGGADQIQVDNLGGDNGTAGQIVETDGSALSFRDAPKGGIWTEDGNSPRTTTGVTSDQFTLSGTYDVIYAVVQFKSEGGGFDADLRLNGDTGGNYNYIVEDGTRTTGDSAAGPLHAVGNAGESETLQFWLSGRFAGNCRGNNSNPGDSTGNITGFRNTSISSPVNTMTIRNPNSNTFDISWNVFGMDVDAGGIP